MLAGKERCRLEELQAGTLLTSSRYITVFVTTKEDTGACQPGTLAWEWYNEQQSVANVKRDCNSPIFLRNILPLNVPRKNDNLLTQSLNPAYKRPDARPTAGIGNALVAKQVQSDGKIEVRMTMPWHERRKEIFGVG